MTFLCYTIIFCTQCMEGAQYEGYEVITFSSVASSCGLLGYVISTRNAPAVVQRKWDGPLAALINKHGPPFHTSCVTDLHRHKNIFLPAVTTAMAAAKFVVSISSTYMHMLLFSSVLFCVTNTKSLCVWKA
jgi:hypothetical protein